jgi:hypothetical protein
VIPGELGQEEFETPSQWEKTEPGGTRLSTHLPQENRRIMVQAGLDKKQDYLKNNQRRKG